MSSLHHGVQLRSSRRHANSGSAQSLTAAVIRFAVVRRHGKLGRERYAVYQRDSVVTSKSAVPLDKTIVDEEGKYVTDDMLPGDVKRVRYGVAGLASEGYLMYYENGKLVDRKLVRRDVYRSVQGVIAVKP